MPWPIPLVVDLPHVVRDLVLLFLFGLPLLVMLLGAIAAVDALIPGTDLDPTP